MNYGQIAVDRGKKYIGTKESPPGSNYGPMVGIFEQVTGALYQPWCASFVMFLLNLTGYDISVFSRSAYVPFIAARARQLGMRVGLRSIQRGDIVCYDWGKDGIPDHVGIATESPGPAGYFLSLEGNTAVGNDSNGGQVMVRRRHVSQVHTAFRLPEKPAPKEKVVKPKPAWPTPIPRWFWSWAVWKLHGSKRGRRPKVAPRLIPPWAWRRLAALKKGRIG